ncbi:MAG: inositol monophosphatase family protein [Planctomycetota bacterium]|jgi:myo-inositol-1(or 4)-monophosphatase
MSKAIDSAECMRVARMAASAAGEVLSEFGLRAGRVPSESKGVRRELVTEADEAAERAAVACLLEAFPEHAILAEEGALTPRGKASQESDSLWIIDPLDGTTNFVHELPFYCVAIGLQHRGEMQIGVVHAPALSKTFTAELGAGAFCNDEPIGVSRTAEVADSMLCTGFSYVRNEPGKDDNVGRMHRALMSCRDLRRFGSAQLDLCMTAAGHYDGYWELDLMAYDVAAGSLIVREAGGTISDLSGADDWLYGGQILASNGLLHEPLLELVGNRVDSP